jgi:hypothetical protein
VFEERFDACRMTADYLEVYRQLAVPGSGAEPTTPLPEGPFGGRPAHLAAGLLGPVEWGCRAESAAT